MKMLDYNKVLVVDDEADLRELFMFEFEDLGFEVMEAVDGMDALEKLKTFPAFLVFSDINMPNMTGVEMLEIIQKDTSARPYVVLCSGFSGYEKDVLIKKGAYDLISKPFDFEKIGKLVKELKVNVNAA